MKSLLIVLLLLFFASGCDLIDGNDDAPAAAASTNQCSSFVFTEEMIAQQYTGTTVTTSGTCDNGGQEYQIKFDGDYNVAASTTGWRLINGVLTTNGGNINFTTGGRFQTTDGVNEGAGLTFGGVDNITCQNAHSVNGTADKFQVNVTAEFDSNCNIQLRGTFREYAQCSGGNPEVVICSGNITLTR